MDCRQFRKQHAYFIDDMLSGVETWAMRDHLTTCLSCVRLDSQLRRSLLIARQAPTLEPSREFQRRLSARLAAEKLARPAFSQVEPPRKRRRAPLIAAAAAAFAAAGIGIFGRPASAPVAAMPAVLQQTSTARTVARVEKAVEPTRDQPVHPAMLLAQRATEQLVAIQARAASVRVAH